MHEHCEPRTSVILNYNDRRVDSNLQDVTSVVVCGSVKSSGEKMEQVGDTLRVAGYKVVTPRMVPYYNTDKPEEKVADREFYYDAIREHEAILIVGRAGAATCMEIGFARALGKKIFYHDMPDELEHRALIHSGHAELWCVL